VPEPNGRHVHVSHEVLDALRDSIPPEPGSAWKPEGSIGALAGLDVFVDEDPEHGSHLLRTAWGGEVRIMIEGVHG
jgi:hypothetical protein